MEVTYRI